MFVNQVLITFYFGINFSAIRVLTSSIKIQNIKKIFLLFYFILLI